MPIDDDNARFLREMAERLAVLYGAPRPAGYSGDPTSLVPGEAESIVERLADDGLYALYLSETLQQALDNWNKRQAEPAPSRPEAVRRALADHLRAKGYLPAANENKP